MEFAALQRGRCAISCIHPNVPTPGPPTSRAVQVNLQERPDALWRGARPVRTELGTRLHPAMSLPLMRGIDRGVQPICELAWRAGVGLVGLGMWEVYRCGNRQQSGCHPFRERRRSSFTLPHGLHSRAGRLSIIILNASTTAKRSRWAFTSSNSARGTTSGRDVHLRPGMVVSTLCVRRRASGVSGYRARTRVQTRSALRPGLGTQESATRSGARSAEKA